MKMPMLATKRKIGDDRAHWKGARVIAVLLALVVNCGSGTSAAAAEDGYDLWLRYRPLPAGFSVVVNYDNFRLDDRLAERCFGMIRGLAERYGSSVTR